MSRRSILRAALMVAAVAFTPPAVRGQDGSWAGVATGSWGNAANWQGGVIANGAGSTATFGNAIPAPVTVTLDINRTIGNITFDNIGNLTNPPTWTIGGSTTLTFSGADPTVNVFLQNLTANISTQLAGNQGFTKVGPGTLRLTDVNNMTGGIRLNEGTLAVTRTATANPLGTNAITLGGGTLRLGAVGSSPFATTGGYNQDVIRSVADPAAAPWGVTAPVDAVDYVYYENGIPGAPATGGLPGGDRTFISAQNPLVTYQMQPYGDSTANNNNSIRLAATNENGTVSLVTPQQFQSLSVLHSTGSGTSRYTATLTFTDNTTSVYGGATGFLSNDWFGGTPFALSSLNRFNITNGTFQEAGTNPRLYATDIALTAADRAKTVQSITVTKVSGGGFLNVFGFSGSGGTPIAQNFSANAVDVTADSTIDLQAPDAAATLGNLSIGANTLTVVSGIGGNLTVGAVALSGNPIFNTGTGATLTTGAVNDGGTARTITKTGAGTLALSAPAASAGAGTQLAVNAGAVNLNAAGALGTQADVTITSGTLGIGAPQTIASLSGGGGLNLGNALTINGPTATTYTGGISGTGSLTRTGGALTLDGTSSYSGGTTINASSTLTATSSNALGTGPVNLNGGTLVVAGARSALTGFGTVGTDSTTNGTATVAADVLTLTTAAGGQAGSLFFNNRVRTNAFTASFTYNATAGSGNPADGVTFTFQNDPRGAAALGDGGGALGYGGGAAITPSAALQLNIYQPAGGGRGVTLAANGATGGPYTLTAPLELYNTTVTVNLSYDGTNLTADFNDGTNSFTFGPVAVDLGSLVGGQAFVGFTGGTGGEFANQTISNFTYQTPTFNTYTNAVNVSGGQTGVVNVLASTDVPTVTMGALGFGSNANLTVGADAATPANQSFGLNFGAVTLNGNHTVTVANNGTGSGTVSFGAVGGVGSLTKVGAGTLNLTAGGTYDGGTTVNAGTLLVTNTTGSATGTGTVLVANGATLGGTGTASGAVMIAQGGSVTPGLSIGTLTTGNLTLNGRYAAEVSTAPDASDRIAVNGNLTLGSTSVLDLPVTNTYAPVSAAAIYTLMTYNGSLSGQFATTLNMPAGYLIQYGTLINGAITLSPVPEPAHILLIAAGAGGLLRWRRGKKN